MLRDLGEDFAHLCTLAGRENISSPAAAPVLPGTIFGSSRSAKDNTRPAVTFESTKQTLRHSHL